MATFMSLGTLPEENGRIKMNVMRIFNTLASSGWNFIQTGIFGGTKL